MLIQKLLQVLRSQLAFVQHLFQREPEALKCQEDERVQLEVMARALQQQALEREVALHTRLQVCSAQLLKAIRIHTYPNEKPLVGRIFCVGLSCSQVKRLNADILVSALGVDPVGG